MGDESTATRIERLLAEEHELRSRDERALAAVRDASTVEDHRR